MLSCNLKSWTVRGELEEDWISTSMSPFKVVWVGGTAILMSGEEFSGTIFHLFNTVICNFRIPLFMHAKLHAYSFL